MSATLTKPNAAHNIRSITLYEGSISAMDPGLCFPDMATCIEVSYSEILLSYIIFHISFILSFLILLKHRVIFCWLFEIKRELETLVDGAFVVVGGTI